VTRFHDEMEAVRRALNDAARVRANAAEVERRPIAPGRCRMPPHQTGCAGEGSLVVEGGGAWTALERSRPATAPIGSTACANRG
jgi:hypothetical protein